MADGTKMHVLGPGTISLDGVDVGYVSAVSLEVTPEMVPLITAAYGKTPLDLIRISEEAKLVCTFDEVSMVQYQKAIQGAVRNTSGANENISVGSFAGTRMTPMVLAYIPRDTSIATAFSFTAWRAVPTGSKKIELNDKQQMLNAEFTLLVDESKAEGIKLFAFGNVSVVTDAVAPTVTTYTPADDATGQSVAVAPTILFNKAMNPSTINAGSIMMFTALDVGAQAAVAGAVTLNAAGTLATFTPTSSLTATTAYNLVVTSGAKSASNVAFAGAKISFTTT